MKSNIFLRLYSHARPGFNQRRSQDQGGGKQKPRWGQTSIIFIE